MRRTLLGTWSTPSGNSCDVFVLPGEDPLRQLALEWDRYPLSPADEIHYVGIILPAITRRAREYLETPGTALVVRT